MPRPKTAVKSKPLLYPGAVDIHFHGAFGIDLMRATPAEMDRLCIELWKNGVAAFCPTTLSSPLEQLLETVTRIGKWMKMRKKNAVGAIPLGLHLEGPYLSSAACGAHPKSAIRVFSLSEIETLWQASQQSLKILTIAPEALSSEELVALHKWSKKNKVVLSLGHSRATEEEASLAFEHGFTNVTHAWNALSFHHRAPGPLGAALGREGVHLELILDGIHVAPTVIDWTRRLHSNICFVSDCVPAAETTPGSWHPFGALKIQFRDGAGRTSDGHLAGGGRLITHLYADWIAVEAKRTGKSPSRLIAESQGSLNLIPLQSLGLSPDILAKHQIQWKSGTQGRVTLRVDSP